MKQNPCRYCALAREHKGNHFPRRWNEKCVKCEYNKKHREYLKSQRKFVPGEQIQDLQELMDQQYVFVTFSDIPKHIEVVKSWQFRFVVENLQAGRFHRAIRKNIRREESISNGKLLYKRFTSVS